jgi:uncharacterized membrane-anchored protein YhcB (DUF1043 family)
MKWAAAILAAVAGIAIGLWLFKDAPLTPDEIAQINLAWNPPPLHETRGPKMPIVAFLQAPSGISVDTSIPVWGVLLVVIAAVGAFAALKMQMTAHEKSDDTRFQSQEKSNDDRFDATNAMLLEIRGDIKHLTRTVVGVIREEEEIR